MRHRLLLLGLLAGCQASGPPSNPAPATPEPTAAPQAEAVPEPVVTSPFDPKHVDAAMQYSAEHGGHAVLIVHEGKEVASAFHNGWEPATPHPLASGTKSFWGPLVVAAIDDGLVSSLDEVAADTLTEWQDDPRKRAITIRQLLSFTSGLAPDIGVTAETVSQSDMFTLAVGAAAEADPGAKWAYSDSAHTAVGALLERKLQAKGSNLEAYLTERMLAPLGIEVGPWLRDAKGHLLMPSGARLTPDQWATYGEMIRLGGKGPDGSSILSGDLLEDCFAPSSAPPAGQFYGLGWWLTSYTTYKYDLPKMHIAGGSGGQFLLVMPEDSLTIVRFGTGDDFVDGEFLCRLFHGADTKACPAA
ncbi:MAG: serine hydrolase domain-containing protein [Myxococcota bacterium]